MGRVTINGTIAQFSCKQRISKDLWDAKGNRAKGKSREAVTVNYALDNIKAQITKHYQYNPQIQISAESGTKRSIFRQKNKTKRSKKRLRTTLIKSEQKVNETSVPALYFRKNTFRMAF